MTKAKKKHRDNDVELSTTPKRIVDSEAQGQVAAAPLAVAIVPERRWAIDCTDPKLRNRLRERFERLVACAVEVELGRKHDHQCQAADAWLDLLKREKPSGPEWKIGSLLRLSAERCKELRLRALTDRNSWAAKIFREIDGELRTLLAQNPRDELRSKRKVRPSILFILCVFKHLQLRPGAIAVSRNHLVG